MNAIAVDAEKVLGFNKLLTSNFFKFTESEIEISALLLAQNFTVYHREILLDLFHIKYKDQQIFVDCMDFEFEHLRHNGFWNFLEWLADEFSIPKNKIIVHTTDKNFSTPFLHKVVGLNIFSTAHRWLKDSKDNLPGPDFAKQLELDACLLGSVVGRFCVPRLRLMYELDQNFPSTDLLLIYTQSKQEVKDQLKFLKCDDQYWAELDWLNHRQFDQDSSDMSGVDQDKYKNAADGWARWLMRYHKLWSRYHIEIVAETDVFTPCVFTEKTARCLATGKPFVLLAAPKSLEKLREMGFLTFGDIIDESYDQTSLPNQRISSMIQSLQQLNQSDQRSELLQRLYQRAQENIKIYKAYADH